MPGPVTDSRDTCVADLPRGQVGLVLWVQDLVLSAALSLDGIGNSSAGMLQHARLLERFAANSADLVIVCSPGFRDYFTSIGVKSQRVRYLHNWVDLERIQESASPSSEGRSRFLYAGNLGYTQGFETLTEAARLVGASSQIDIVGGGNALDRVRALAAPLSNVSVREAVPEPEFPALLASAHAHILLQRRVSAGANLPSKIGPYLASGRPIVASIEPTAPAAELLRRSGAAVMVPPEDAEALALAMRDLAGQPRLREALGRKARRFAVANFGKEQALSRLEKAVVG